MDNINFDVQKTLKVGLVWAEKKYDLKLAYKQDGAIFQK